MQNFVMYDLIAKKRDGFALDQEQIRFWLSGALSGVVPDYQTAAMLMAIYFRGMTEREIFYLTEEMVNSGERLNLAPLGNMTADKHSTGGVGDKTTFIAMPIAAACGLKIAKMSGRSLGKTGGTADKLESISGFRLNLSEDELLAQVADVGLALISQSKNLTPADKRLYALRDLTATVDSLPLIAASVMSKKIAAGSRTIVLDVKFGSGAFMPTANDAQKLAELLVKLGKHAGRNVSAIISSMQSPLGEMVGNAVEVFEATEVLQGRGPADTRELSLALAAEMLWQAGAAQSREAAITQAALALDSGGAWQKFQQFIAAQGGDIGCLNEGGLLTAKFALKVGAVSEGFVSALPADEAATLVQRLGAGRERIEDTINHRVGIRFCKRPGDEVRHNDTLAIVYANDVVLGTEVGRDLQKIVRIDSTPPQTEPLIYGLVDADGFHSWPIENS